MFILSEYYLKGGNAESHSCWVFNSAPEARNKFRKLAEETKRIFPNLDVTETENAHWEESRPDGLVDVYDLALIETSGEFVRE